MKQLYPSWRFHPDGRERLVQNPAEDHLLKAEDKAWGDRPPHGVAHDKAWEQANRQPRQEPVSSRRMNPIDLDALSALEEQAHAPIATGDTSIEPPAAPVARTTVKPAKKPAKKPAESITPTAAAAAEGSAPTRPKKVYKP